MNLGFKGKHALITGGSRGIGYAIGAKLLELGAEVWITGREPRDESPLDGASYSACDFSDREDAARFVRELESRDRLDLLVNNAGINKIGPIDTYDVVDADRIWDVNVRVPFMITQAACVLMKRHGWGRIVNITSIFGHVTKEKRSAYTTSKFALAGMTKTTAVDMAPFGILANSVAPGFVNTELTRRILRPEDQAELAESVPMGRFAEPDEIANTVLFLLSEANSYLTGQNIIIDGGFTIV